MCGVPEGGQQLEGVGDARNEDEAHGEEGDEYDGCFTVVKHSAEGLPKERGGEHKGEEERHQIQR